MRRTGLLVKSSYHQNSKQCTINTHNSCRHANVCVSCIDKHQKFVVLFSFRLSSPSLIYDLPFIKNKLTCWQRNWNCLQVLIQVRFVNYIVVEVNSVEYVKSFILHFEIFHSSKLFQIRKLFPRVLENHCLQIKKKKTKLGQNEKLALTFQEVKIYGCKRKTRVSLLIKVNWFSFLNEMNLSREPLKFFANTTNPVIKSLSGLKIFFIKN